MFPEDLNWSDEAAVGLLLLQRQPNKAARPFDMLDRSVRRRYCSYVQFSSRTKLGQRQRC